VRVSPGVGVLARHVSPKHPLFAGLGATVCGPLHLAGYANAQLWTVVYQRLAWPQSQRLHELSAKNKLERLTEDEQHELGNLLSSNDRAMLLRSEALCLLKNRGYDIEAYLKRGA
jgi:hypothetical protein